MTRLWRKMKAPQLLVGLVLSLSLLAGCAGMPAQNPYMVTGAGLGAATGAALGIAANNRNPWKGAAIGGLLGAALGGVGGEVYGRSVNPPPYYQPPPSYSPPPASYSAPPPGYSYAQPAPQYYNYY
jgi:hypothetical protein